MKIRVFIRVKKGGPEFEGCIGHNAVFNEIFEQAHLKRDIPKSAVIAWFDLRNAFPSVPHQYLWNNLRAIGVGEKFVHTLEELYVRRVRVRRNHSSSV